MEIPRPLAIAAALSLFVGFVLFIVPPTEPKSGPPPIIASRFAPPVTVATSGAVSAIPDRTAPVTDAPPSPSDPADTVAISLDENPPARSDGFAEGYRWASAAGVQDRRECRRLAPGPIRAGCHEYLEGGDYIGRAGDEPPVED